MDVVVTLAQETRLNGTPMGLDLETGEALIPEDSGIWDNYCVKESVYSQSIYLKMSKFTYKHQKETNPRQRHRHLRAFPPYR